MERIAVLSDIHLGRRAFRKQTNGTNTIEFLGYKQWIACLENIIENKPDCLIIAGDLFHSPNPCTLAIDACLKGFKLLETNKIETYIISGNHDCSLSLHLRGQHCFKNLGTWKYVHMFIDIQSTDIGFFLPYQYEDKKVYSMIKSKNIIVAHGILDIWAERFKIKECLSSELIKEFDIAIIGDIHTPFIQVLGGTKIFVPGRIMEEEEVGPLYINIKTKEHKRIHIPTVEIKKIRCESVKELNDVLRNVKEHIYFLTFPGNWEDVNPEYYELAIKNSIHINIQTQEKEKLNPYQVKDFWEHVANFKPEYLGEFKKCLEE